MNLISALLIFFIILSYQGLTQSLERVEPPFWWVGMNNTELQLLLYGKDISELTPVSSSMNIKVMADQEGLLKDGLSVKANSAMLLELRK
jgi:hypothetical protein